MQRRMLPIWALIVIDLLATGCCLCIYALFHHVLPRSYAAAVPAATAAAPTVTAAPAEYTPAPTAEPTAAPAETPVPLPTTQFSFPGLFSDEIIWTDDSYTSGDVAVTLSIVREKKSAYYVADITVSDVTLLRSALANDTYGRGIRQHPLEMAKAHSAVVAINGDYYGINDKGVVIRNGVLYRGEADADVCVLYYDGTMKTFLYKSETFDADAEMENGAYQAWCFGPSLLNEDGSVREKFTSRLKEAAPRSAIGYFEPGHYCFVAVDGRRSDAAGMGMSELAALMHALGCKVAYNLDGGQSSCLIFHDELVNRPKDDGRESSDIIYVAEPKEANDAA